jgi:hypothetical protein
MFFADVYKSPKAIQNHTWSIHAFEGVYITPNCNISQINNIWDLPMFFEMSIRLPKET